MFRIDLGRDGMIVRGWAGLSGSVLAAASLAGGLMTAGAPTALAAGSAAPTIATVAGGPGRGPATQLSQQPADVAIGPGGKVYVVDPDNSVIREFGTTKPYESVAAGIGISGYSRNGGPASSAKLADAQGAAVDAAGNLVIADYLNNRIRVVAATTGTFYGQAMTAGDIYTVAGNGHVGHSGDGGPATSAKLDEPSGVAVDTAGNLLIADTGNSRVRVVAATTGTFYGQAMTAGDIYTVAGDGTAGYSGNGGPATSAELNLPEGVAADAAGNLLIADTENSSVRVVAATTGTFYGQAMTAGDIYTVAGMGFAGYSGNGGPATSATLRLPEGVAVDAAGNLVIADFGNARVRVVADTTGTFYGQAMTAGDIYTVAGTGSTSFSGSGGLAVNAELGHYDLLGGATVDAGNYVAVYNNLAWFICETSGTYFGQAMTAGNIYRVAGNGLTGYSGNGGPATSAELYSPGGVAVDAAGNLVIADTGNARVRVVADTTGTFYGQAMTAGHIYTIAGTGRVGYAGYGGPATSAELDGPAGVAVDTAGNLVIADSGNQRVRVVAATTGTFYGRAMTAGDIYDVAGDGVDGFSGDGGRATSAELDYPEGAAVDAAGNLVIADPYNQRVRVVAATTGTFYGQAMTAGDIYTVAGDGTSGYAGDGGPATSAELSLPEAVAVDGSGNLVIADTFNQRVRVVAATTGTFYGQAMTAGDIYTVAGNGTAGFAGDGGPATSAELDYPYNVAADGSGNLVIIDTDNFRVRLVSG
jgi:trimeric autotransporter adhesin